MTRVVVHIGQLVVHGAGSFVADMFGSELREQVRRRIGDGASATSIAGRLRGGPSPASGGDCAARASAGQAPHTPERAAAARLSERLLR